MLEFIALISLVFSLVGLGVIIYRKIPLILEFPGDFSRPNKENSIEKIKNLNPFNSFSSGVFLQKILSKIRILTLKTDTQTSIWLQSLREKNKKDNFGRKNDNYWKEVKRSTKKENE